MSSLVGGMSSLVGAMSSLVGAILSLVGAGGAEGRNFERPVSAESVDEVDLRVGERGAGDLDPFRFVGHLFFERERRGTDSAQQ